MDEKIFLKAQVYGAQLTPAIQEIAKKVGIVLPSTHTAIFRTVYAPIEKPNGNGIRLARHAVEKALPGLVGSQVNLEHLGKGFMVGIILDARLNDKDEIETIFTFAKNIYEEDYFAALEKMQEGQLSVSFELFSVIETKEYLDDGTVRLHDIDFQGQGLLIEETPAYGGAIVFDMAKKYKERAIRYKDSKNLQEKEVLFANQIVKSCDEVLNPLNVSRSQKDDYTILEVKSKNTDVINRIDAFIENIKDTSIKETKGEKGSMELTQEQKEEIKALREEFGDLAKDVSDEDLLKAEKVEELRKANEEKEEDSETEDTKETDEEQEDTEESKLEALKKENAELKDKVSSLESALKAKDSEVIEVRENAEKIGQRKTELKDNEFAKDFKDEDYLDDTKVEKAKTEKAEAEEKAKKIEERKEELKDNEFAKDFSDVDYLNDDKVEVAKLKKENAELSKSKETANKEDTDKDEKVIAGSEDETKKPKTVHEIVHAAYNKKR